MITKNVAVDAVVEENDIPDDVISQVQVWFADKAAAALGINTTDNLDLLNRYVISINRIIRNGRNDLVMDAVTLFWDIISEKNPGIEPVKVIILNTITTELWFRIDSLYKLPIKDFQRFEDRAFNYSAIKPADIRDLVWEQLFRLVSGLSFAERLFIFHKTCLAGKVIGLAIGVYSDSQKRELAEDLIVYLPSGISRYAYQFVNDLIAQVKKSELFPEEPFII